MCPYSYLESYLGEAAEEAGDLDLEWLPLELRPAPEPLLEPRGDHLRVDWSQNVYRRALTLGIEIHLPRFQPRSTLPLAACLWASEQSALRSFKRALYTAFFLEGTDIATDYEIARAATRAELDPEQAVAAAYSAELIGRLVEIRREASTAGVRGVPTLLTSDGSVHWGTGGIERYLAGEPLVPRPA